jgi:hypothetical protein
MTDARRRPTVPEVLPLVRRYLEREPTGGSLHIVLDDGNLRDSDLEFCYRFAMRDQALYADHPYGQPRVMSEPPDHEGAALALILLSMSPTQRRKIYRSA